MMAFRVDRSSSVFSFGGLAGLLSFSFKTKSLLLASRSFFSCLKRNTFFRVDIEHGGSAIGIALNRFLCFLMLYFFSP